MKKPRLAAIEYIRGISMMGVIGIHVGSQYLENPSANLHLIALFEVFTRFSVPIFFFISAFGLFYNLNINEPFHYKDFMKRRLRTVLIPYIFWSFFYITTNHIFHGSPFPGILELLRLFFFGLTQYHLYFLVILLWFYLLMPLWIAMVRRMGIQSLLLLLLCQIGFNYFSSFNASFYYFIADLPEDSLLKPFLAYRLNYWVFHYIFIFLLGGWLSVHIREFQNVMQAYRLKICLFFWLSLAALLGYYYELVHSGASLLEAIYTAHQLCPAGVIYTIAASLFFFTIFTYQTYPGFLNPLFSLLGRHSYFSYLAHPLFLTAYSSLAAYAGHLMTAPVAIVMYFAVLCTVVLVAVVCRYLGQFLPLLNQLTIGISAPKKTPLQNH